MARDLAYYRALPYTRRVVHKENEGEWTSYFVASIEELEGCFATGKKREDAIYNLQLMFDDYIQGLLDMGDDFKEPEHPAFTGASEVEIETSGETQNNRYYVLIPDSIRPEVKIQAAPKKWTVSRESSELITTDQNIGVEPVPA